MQETMNTHAQYTQVHSYGSDTITVVCFCIGAWKHNQKVSTNTHQNTQLTGNNTCTVTVSSTYVFEQDRMRFVE